MLLRGPPRAAPPSPARCPVAARPCRPPALPRRRPPTLGGVSFPAASAGAAGEAAAPVPAPAPAKARWGGLARRVGSGVALAGGAAAVVASGGWPLAVLGCLIVHQCSQEYYGFVTSKGIADSMTAPLPAASPLTSALCAGIVLWTHASSGRQTAALAVAAFALLSYHLLAPERPRFAQVTSSVFGLFYCGYLPSFWVKLRLLAAPAAGSALAARWPPLFGGPPAFTVGLAATFTAVACVIAADTGAYFTGKLLGRTQLSAASPKKTVEGAAGGAVAAVAAALAGRALTGWPAHPAVAGLLGGLVFCASLFGDLLESVMKRDAGVKDSSDLIPGHGGLLDRFDSYIFTGAIVYVVLRFVVPNFGV